MGLAMANRTLYQADEYPSAEVRTFPYNLANQPHY